MAARIYSRARKRGKGVFSSARGRPPGQPSYAGHPAIAVTIEAGSLDTNNPQRDKHLRSSDFFDFENHPLVRFVSDSATLDNERLKVRGRLYSAGKSITLEINAGRTRVGDGE